MNEQPRKPVALIILDGWGYREERQDNAIANARTPVWDRLWREAPHTLVSGSGLDVGLPDGQMGNSEVGHMTLGAGRVIYQSMTRIDQAIADGSFDENPAYRGAIDAVLASGGALHLFGLLSPGGVHSHERHFAAMIKLASRLGVRQVYLHAFLDGRDTPPRSAAPSLAAMDELLASLQCGRIASVVGRYYAMDRDQRWERIEAAYRMLTEGAAPYHADSAEAALAAAYERGEDDEFVKPTLVGQPVSVSDGDAVIFMNFRADRARQLSRAFTEAGFDAFERARAPLLSGFVTTTEYAADIEAAVAFPPEGLVNGLPEYLSRQGRTQLRIAETEKYAHVTFFFSGGIEDCYEGEERVLIPSPDVATYDLQPAMSAREVTDKLVDAIGSGSYDLIVCNFANGDMVGHTGNYEAAVEAVEVLDECLGRIEAALLAAGGEALITADHGNCEQMVDYASGQNHTQHTTELVPLVYLGGKAVHFNGQGGILADVAPTILQLMNLAKPAEMTGHSLLELG
jgi:2,3-bisphosphoglycerate-independent phosphoglycerate mutase